MTRILPKSFVFLFSFCFYNLLTMATQPNMPASVAVLTLNCQGLRDPSKRAVLFSWLNCVKADIVCLQETHSTSTAEFTRWIQLETDQGNNRCHFHGTSSPGTCRSRGSAVLYRNRFQLDKQVSDQCGRFQILHFSYGTACFQVVNLYGPNKKSDGDPFFEDLLSRLHPALQTILCGDFNTVVDASLDRRGCNPSSPWAYNWPSALSTLTHQMDLHDIWRLRHPRTQAYTWHRADGSQASRLDMFWLSSSLLEHVHSVEILPFFRSDHCYVYLKLSIPSTTSRGPGIWKFNSSLLQDPAFTLLITNFWREWQSEKAEYPSLAVWWNAGKQFLKEIIRDYSKKKAKARSSELCDLNDRLRQLHVRQDNGEDVARLIQDVKSDIEVHHVHLSRGAKIRAKETWAEEGERSTHYFFSKEKSQGVRRIISGIRNIRGRIVRSITCILQVWVFFFTSLFSASPTLNFGEQTFFLDSLDLKLSSEDSERCEGAVSAAECHAALLSFKRNKSPGLDGLTYEFYQHFWDLLGDDMVAMFNECFSLGKLALSQRTAVITLLFKKGDRLDPANWRPISLLCTDYKILAKVLTFRLRSVISSVISDVQSCGIPGRFSGENVRLFQDAIDYANSRNIGGALLSLDQEKAFDRVDWNFLFRVLKCMNFGPQFCSWVRLLYTALSSRVLVNGVLSEAFPVTRGVRQGCPLSPLLFVLVSETIGRAILKDPLIDGFQLPDNSCVKLGQYADDTSVFVGSDQALRALIALFSRYENASGAKLNVGKSHGLLFGSWKDRGRLPVDLRWTNTSIVLLGCRIGNDVTPDWSALLEKFKTNLSLWKRRELSFRGRALVANTLGLSIFWYQATLFAMPKTVIFATGKLLFPFVWQKKREPLARSSVVQPLKAGGLGVVNVAVKLSSLRATWIRRLFSSSPRHPWVVFFAYHVDAVFHQDLDTFLARDTVPEYRIKKLPPFYASLVRMWLSVRGTRDGATWVVPRPSLPPIPASELTCSFVYRFLMRVHHVPHRCEAKFTALGISVQWNDVWQSLVLWRFVRSVQDTAWTSFHGVLPTADRLLRFGMAVSPLCACGHDETLIHLFTSCPFSRQIWQWFDRLFRQTRHRVVLSPTILLFGFPQSSGVPVVFSALLGVLRHHIWLTRNKFCFEHLPPNFQVCLRNAKSSFKFLVRLEVRACPPARVSSDWLANGIIGHQLHDGRIVFNPMLC